MNTAVASATTPDKDFTVSVQVLDLTEGVYFFTCDPRRQRSSPEQES
jgi:hypothetical protein